MSLNIIFILILIYITFYQIKEILGKHLYFLFVSISRRKEIHLYVLCVCAQINADYQLILDPSTDIFILECHFAQESH